MLKELRIAGPSFTVALLAGFYSTVQITGSIDRAFERMITIVVLWMACALTWQVLLTLMKSVVQAAGDRSHRPSGREWTYGHSGSER